MSDYHFKQNDNWQEQTRRLDDITKAVRNQTVSERTKQHCIQEELEDKDAFLNTLQSERWEETYQGQRRMASYPVEDARQEKAKREKRWIAVGAVLCVLLFMGAFFLVRFGLEAGAKNPGSQTPGTPIGTQKLLFLVTSVSSNGELAVYDTKNDTDYLLQLDENVTYRDAAGVVTAPHAISNGELIAALLSEDKKTIIEIEKPKDAWIKEDATGISVDTGKKSIKLASGEQLSYQNETLFLYQEEPISPAELAAPDVLLLQGEGNRLWSCTIIGFHGYVSVKNVGSIENAAISLDGGKAIPLEGEQKIPVPEGSHELVVTGSNIEPGRRSIFLQAREEYVVDLSQAQQKTGVLALQVNQTDYKLYINGAETDASQPIVLPMGSYDLVILKQGFHQWNQTVTLTEPTMTVSAQLEPEVQYGLLSISSGPSGAKVYLDHTEIGVTPIMKELPYGQYALVLKAQGYEIYTETITVDRPEVKTEISLQELTQE